MEKLRSLMTKSDLEKLIHAFISSKLDYCNGLLTGPPMKSIRQLQLIQNAAARVLLKAKRSDHITPLGCIHTATVSLHQSTDPIDFAWGESMRLPVYKQAGRGGGN